MKYKIGQYRRFAEDDFKQLEINMGEGFAPYQSTCVHAQQYAEKMLKEKQVEFGMDPRFEHNLVTILNELSVNGLPITEDIYSKASILSNYYMTARYPGYKDLEFGEETAAEAYQYSLDIVGYIDMFFMDEGGNICMREPVASQNRKKRSLLDRLRRR